MSVTVGICVFVSGDNVSKVRSVGPIPRIPSTPSKPSEEEATPMDCFVIVRPLPIETVSVNSVPLNSPEPYVTDCGGIMSQQYIQGCNFRVRTTLSLVCTEVLVFL